MTDAITSAIQQEIQKAQQPLLERIAELEKIQERDGDYIWKLNILVSALMKAFPAEHAQMGCEHLQEFLKDYSEEQRGQDYRVMELYYWHKQLEELATLPRG